MIKKLLKPRKCKLKAWAREHGHKNVVHHNGKTLRTEKEFKQAGFCKQASPTFEEWQQSMR